MKKSKKSGFVLAETITISVVVMVSLVGIYMQFSSLANAYYRSYQYNSVNNLYLTNNIRHFILTDKIDEIINKADSNNYVDLSSCSDFTNSSFCKTLYDSVGAKKVIVTKKDVGKLKEQLDTTNFNENLKKFIKAINAKDDIGYRLIVEYEYDNFATLLLR